MSILSIRQKINFHESILTFIFLSSLTLLAISLLNSLSLITPSIPLPVQWSLMSSGLAGILITTLFFTCYYLKNRSKKLKNFINEITECGSLIKNKSISGIYILSNEQGKEKVAEELAKWDVRRILKCHLGCGAFYNFDVAAIRKSDCCIIFDFNENNSDFIKASLIFIQQAKGPKEFVDQIIEYIRMGVEKDNTKGVHQRKYNHYDGYESPIVRLKRELQRKESWLYERDQTGKFEHIKQLALKNRIIPLTQDFTRTESFKNMVNVLNRYQYEIDTIYLSNLSAFVNRLEDFYNTLACLTERSSPLVIHCIPPRDCRCALGCFCAKVQQIGNIWEKTSREQGVITLKKMSV